LNGCLFFEKNQKKTAVRYFMGKYKKSMNAPLNKKIFCFGAFFFIFFTKNKKKGAKTSFYFAAEGGEIRFYSHQAVF